MYPGQQYHQNHGQYQPPPQGPAGYYAPPQGPPPGGYYAPPPGAPPPNMQTRPQQYHPPSGPPPDPYSQGYRQHQVEQYGAPPPPPQQAQMFNQQVGNQYTFQYSNCSGKRKVLPSPRNC